MRGRPGRAALWVSALTIVLLPIRASGAARDPVVHLDTAQQSLAIALLEVARQSGVELILAAPSARTMKAPKLRGRYTVDEALERLLAGSGLTYRRSQDGAYVVSTLVRAPADREAVAIPEILVIGKRTQNSDIRRRENDIQPYKVWTSDDVA